MRLIDADALKLMYWVYSVNGTLNESDFRTAIDEQPTVDAVPVVRCYECFQSEPCLKKNSVYCNKFHNVVTRDWYCADGERREE